MNYTQEAGSKTVKKNEAAKYFILFALFALGLLAAPAARAAVTLTAATGGTTQSADTAASATWTTLTGPVAQEAAAGNIGTGTIILTAPSGFQFNTAAVVTVLVNGTGGTSNINGIADGGTIPVAVTATTLTMTISLASTGSGHQDKLTWQNIQVQPTAGTPLATGNTTKSGTATGITSGANCGTLTEVGGAVTSLAFTTQPVGGTYGSALTTQPVVKSQDQFGNNSTNGVGATKNVSLSLTAGTGALTGTTTLNIGTTGTAGIATFAGLQVNAAGSGDVMTASASGLSSANSSSFNVATKALTVAGLTASNKVYDSTTNATLSTGGATLTGVVAGDAVTLDSSVAAGSFATRTVANNKPVTVTGLALAGTNAGNYTLTPPSPNANITKATLTVSGATALSKVYDGGATATVNTNSAALSGVFGGDIVNLGGTAAATFSDQNVGTNKTVTFSGFTISGTDSGNYSLTQPTTTANITPATLTVGATGVNRTYDGTTNSTATLTDNRASGDKVTLVSTAGFADKNVGTNKPVSVTGIAITGGADAGNYVLGNTTANTTANIAAKTLTITVTASSKVYDGTTAATVSLADNRVSGDVLTANYTNAVFSSAAVGTRTATVSGITLSGTDAGNYTVSSTATDSASITARSLTVAGATASDKVYNGSATATVNTNSTSLVGVVSGDIVTLSGTAAGAFSDKNVGTNKTVTISGLTISGTSSGNYSLTQPTTTASITAATLTANATGVSKVYDATTNATVTLSDNHIGTDSVIESYTTAGFADKNVGTNKPVSVSGIAITGGAAAGNYVLANTTANTTANITTKTLTVTATASDKTYDGTNTATAALTDNRVGGDVFTDSYVSATFSSATVANNKTVTVSGISISGTDAGNYTLASTSDTDTANITKAILTVSGVAASNKVYNATTTATVITNGATLVGLVAGETAILGGTPTGAFSDKNVGTNKTVTGSGLTISGGNSANYTLTQPTTTANITPAILTVTAAGVNRLYNGTTNATVTLSDNSLGADVVTESYGTAGFADKNVANGKPVSVGGIVITGGTDSGNYVLGNTTASTTANITKATLTATATAADKVYDKTTTASVVLLDNRASGDLLTLTNTSATFSSAAIGTNKTVSVTGIAVVAGGTDAGNYTLGNTSTSTTASITAKPLTVTGLKAPDRTYDGTTSTVIVSNGPALVGVVSGDTVTLSGTAVGLFSDKNAGTNKTVTVSGLTISGTGAGNYTLTQPTLTAAIMPATLTIVAAGVDRIYDGTTNIAVTLSDNHIGGDKLITAYGSAWVLEKSAAIAKTVGVASMAILGGADAGNYVLGNTTASSTVNITLATLTVTATGVNKIYDGTANATVTLSDNHFGSDLVTENYTTAGFADKNVGTGKLVNVTGISITGGADALNYQLGNTTTTTSASISAALTSITWTNPVNIIYGTSLSGIQLNATSSIVGVFNYTPPAGTILNASNGQTLSVTLVPTDSNFTNTSATVLINILQAASTNSLVASTNSALPGATLTFTAILTAVAPGSGAPTGIVRFDVDGSAAGAANSTNGIAAFNTTSLTHGAHTIAAEYAGDVNFLGSVNTLATQVVINTPPVTHAFVVGGTQDTPTNISFVKLTSTVTDADGDTITLASVDGTSANGGTITSTNGVITYTPPAGSTNTDSFNYVVTDGFGGSANGVVTVNLRSSAVPSPNIVSFAILGNGDSLTKFAGIPGRTYSIQASTNLQNWINVGSVMAATNGMFQFEDTNAASFTIRYYRSSYP